jgi:hypothetical protein
MPVTATITGTILTIRSAPRMSVLLVVSEMRTARIAENAVMATMLVTLRFSDAAAPMLSASPVAARSDPKDNAGPEEDDGSPVDSRGVRPGERGPAFLPVRGQDEQ